MKIKYALSKEKAELLIRQYINRIKRTIGLELAIIFGSYAKGNYSWGSDIDILLVAKKLPKRLLDRQPILIEPNIPIQIDPFAYTPEEFEKMLKEKHPLIIEALKNGKIIYSKGKTYTRLF
ncbi:MAG: nucleotidyltransferase domain-containing protein [Candidatus Bathyarchaeota archaeon]|nr:nucleotidyltransferase domain-containing protein [Candidatus Bathyarchaeota archaeon]